MAKKSFKENPALTFINVDMEAEAESRERLSDENRAGLIEDTQIHTNEHTDKQTYEDTHKNTHTQNQTHEDVYKEGKREDTSHALFIERKEKKSRRLQLLMRPATHEKLRQIAKTYQTSTNEVINEILEDYLKKM